MQNMVESLVSIIMPNYNKSEHIRETINSVLKQTWKNWELIIVDDASTDVSRQMLMRYSTLDSRIKSIFHQENKGAAAARNTGLNHAKGRYLAFIDSDDLWHPHKLARQLSYMKKHDFRFSFTEYCMTDSYGHVLNPRVGSPESVDYRGLVTGQPVMCSSVMLDRKQVGEFRMPDIRSGQDYATWLMLMRTRGIKAHNVGEVLAVYRRTDAGLSGNKFHALRRTWRINRDLEKISVLRNIFYLSIYAVHWMKKHFFSVVSQESNTQLIGKELPVCSSGSGRTYLPRG